eukprot:COSAG01_NODE_1942_length_8842_cov_5.900492_6_plen_205_part_00
MAEQANKAAAPEPEPVDDVAEPAAEVVAPPTADCMGCLPAGGAKAKIVGDYDWGFLCKPQLPCFDAVAPPFFKNKEGMPILVAAVMGLQHALAMVGGIITVPLVVTYSTPFAPEGSPGAPYTLNTPETAQYLVASALICCGLLSLVSSCSGTIWQLCPLIQADSAAAPRPRAGPDHSDSSAWRLLPGDRPHLRRRHLLCLPPDR